MYVSMHAIWVDNVECSPFNNIKNYRLTTFLVPVMKNLILNS